MKYYVKEKLIMPSQTGFPMDYLLACVFLCPSLALFKRKMYFEGFYMLFGLIVTLIACYYDKFVIVLYLLCSLLWVPLINEYYEKNLIKKGFDIVYSPIHENIYRKEQKELLIENGYSWELFLTSALGFPFYTPMIKKDWIGAFILLVLTGALIWKSKGVILGFTELELMPQEQMLPLSQINQLFFELYVFGSLSIAYALIIVFLPFVYNKWYRYYLEKKGFRTINEKSKN